MNTIKVKTSLLIAGFFNGLNLFCFFSNYEKLSNQLSTLKPDISLSNDNGLYADAYKLKSDWDTVKKDITNSVKNANLSATAE
jgi:hypothetical protein